jgi:hypothetical protein
LDIFADSTTRQVRLKNRQNYKEIRTLVSVQIDKDTYPKTELEIRDDGKFVFYVGTKANTIVFCDTGFCI